MNFGSRPKTTKLDHKKKAQKKQRKKHTQLKQTKTTKKAQKSTQKSTNFKTAQIHYANKAQKRPQ